MKIQNQNKLTLTKHKNLKIFQTKRIKHMKNKEHEEHSSRTHQTQLSNQTRSQTIKGKILFAIMHRTRIKDPFASIII
jgi:hypothetical protein